MRYLLMLLTFSCFAQDYNRSLYLLRSQGLDSAKEYVNSVSEKTLYMFGHEISRSSVSNALDWFDMLHEATKDESYLFGKAWMLYRLGETDESLALCKRLLKTKDKTNVARAYFLKGAISLYSGDINESVTYSRKSLESYKSTGIHGGMFQACFNLASAMLAKGDISGAEHYTALARKHSMKSKSKEHEQSRLYELQGQISWMKKDVKKALHWLMQAMYAANSEKQYELGWDYKARIGFYSALLGKTEVARSIAQEIDSICTGLDDDFLYSRNLLTWIYLDKCDGKDSSIRKIELESSSNYKGSGRELLVKFIDSIPCPYVVDK